jgi:hypothetical protein
VLVAGAGTAEAKDDFPCGKPRTSPGGVAHVQYCPLTATLPAGGVPVYKAPYLNSGKVGALYSGGSANWFEGQECEQYSFGTYMGYKNDWWAYTEADNGHWGFVPEVYFKGGKNNERDAGLAIEGGTPTFPSHAYPCY